MFQSKESIHTRNNKLQSISIAFKKIMEKTATRMHSANSPNYTPKTSSTSPQHSPFLRKRKPSLHISKKRKASFQMQNMPQTLNRQITLKFSNCQRSNKQSYSAKQQAVKYTSQSSIQKGNEIYNKILGYNQFLITKTYIFEDISSLKNSKNSKSKRFFTQSRQQSPIFSKTYQSNIHKSQNYSSKIKKCQKKRYFLNRGRHQQQLSKVNDWSIRKGSEIEPWETEKHEWHCFNQ